jgi:TetR/AcrR family transcriptional regulator, mexJK operon transcriptional repressor
MAVAAAKATRGEKRRARLLEAARQVFLERGFEGATLDQVIATAGGSRATLYEQFGDKEGLFAAIVGEICDDIQLPLAGGLGSDPDPGTVLRAFALRFMRRLMEPEALALYRLVIAESRRLPGLGTRVFAAGPERSARALADYLRAQSRAGMMRVRDPDLSVRIFLEMIKGDLHTRALFRAGPPPTTREIEATVRSAVGIFLRGVSA